MTKFQEAIATYVDFMVEKLGDKTPSQDVLVALAQMLGDNIFDKDASLVACSDKAELARVKELFLLKELGLDNSPKLEEAIAAVCKQMGASNRKKYRVVFYYLLLKYFGMESRFGGTTAAVKAEKTEETIPKTAAKSTKTAKATPATDNAATATAGVKPTQKAATNTTVATKAAASLSFEDTIKFYENFVVNEVKYPYYNYDVMVKLAESTGTINEFGSLSIVDLATDGEFKNIKDNFLKGRLGLADSTELDEAIVLVNSRIGDLPKYRVPFYYLLTKHTGREWAVLQQVEANLY
jgi:hypothetical protein